MKPIKIMIIISWIALLLAYIPTGQISPAIFSVCMLMVLLYFY